MASDRRERPLVTSPTRRLLRLGGLVGRVGASIATERTRELLTSGPRREAQRLDNLLRNAARIVETLGEMRGAAMKVGQMLSLHEGLLPPEVNAVLGRLQKEAPRVPPEVMRFEVEGSLGAPISELFEEFDEQAFAAASIGQVHAARLADGRRVAVKVQYPLIREVVTADLKNMRTLFKSLFSLIFDAGFEPIWEEVRDRLLEELDYEHEAENIRRLAELHADVPEIVIPRVVPERSSDRVLTMEMVEGIAPTDAAGDGYPQELRDRWGQVLFEFQMRGLLEHHLLHADPNLANFAFLDDGRVVVYDFGSVKEVPRKMVDAYRELLTALLADRAEAIPEALVGLGMTRSDGSPLELELLAPYIDLLTEILRPEPYYTFGEDPDLYDKMAAVGMQNFSQATDMRFPRDIIFIHRSLGGHFGNLIRLRATGPWAEILRSYALDDAFAALHGE